METKEKTQSVQSDTEDTEALRSQLSERDAKIAELTATIDALRTELAERDYHDAEKFVDAAISDGKFSADGGVNGVL